MSLHPVDPDPPKAPTPNRAHRHRWPPPDPRYLRDLLIVGAGCACIGSQIMAQIKRVDVSGELVISGVTLLTATPFIWKGDRRDDSKGD